MCKIDKCERPSMYVKDDVCQMHYFRFMRNGTYDKVQKKATYRIENPAGYQLLLIPDHPLAQSNGRVYEHRKVAYEKYGETLPDCELCGKSCNWEVYTTHIDHIDRNVRNNNPSNLRPLCNACNSRRDYEAYKVKTSIPVYFNGQIKTAEEWSRMEFCSVKGVTIRRRIESGWDVGKAIKTPSRTIKKRDLINESS